LSGQAGETDIIKTKKRKGADDSCTLFLLAQERQALARLGHPNPLQPGTSKSLFRNILRISHLNPKIWREFFPKPMIPIDRETEKV
jgi:hypothetical protein